MSERIVLGGRPSPSLGAWHRALLPIFYLPWSDLRATTNSGSERWIGPATGNETNSIPILDWQWRNKSWLPATHLATNNQSLETSSSNRSMISLTTTTAPWSTLRSDTKMMKTVWPDLLRCTSWSNGSNESPNYVSDTRNLKDAGTSILRATRWCRRTSRRPDESNEQLDDEQRVSRRSTTILE
jgi:hypothetical protein